MSLPDYRTKEYWDKRVLASKNEQDMIFVDQRREVLWDRVRAQLGIWRSFHVLDVACGFGKFAECFEPPYYTGVDFSEEMLKLACKKFPYHKFALGDAHMPTMETYDVIFEVNSLKSLGMKPEDFISKFKPYARVAVACLEADGFQIENCYGVPARS